MSTSKWNDEQMLKFVNLYKYHTCLWDTDSMHYRTQDMRKSALEDIVNKMEICDFGVAECKNKIKNMRSHYCQELKKMRDSKRFNTIEKMYRPTLLWFDTLDRFLRKHTQSHVKASTKTSLLALQEYPEEPLIYYSDNSDEDDGFNPYTEIPEVDMQLHYDDRDEVEQKYQIPEDSQIPEEHNCTPTIKTEDVSASVAKKRKIDNERPCHDSTTSNNTLTSTALNRIAALLEIRSSETSSTKKETEFDIFGSSVAAQLNNMAFIEAVKLQFKIQQLITQNRVNLYNNERRKRYHSSMNADSEQHNCSSSDHCAYNDNELFK